MYTVLCTLFTLLFTLYHCLQYSSYCILYSLNCSLNIVHYTMYTVFCTLYTVHFTLFAVIFTLYTAYCVIYMVHCILCPKCRFQYIGESERSLQDRFSEHKGYVVNKHLNKATGEHFNLEKIYSQDEMVRKERETMFIRKINTKYKVLNKN